MTYACSFDDVSYPQHDHWGLGSAPLGASPGRAHGLDRERMDRTQCAARRDKGLGGNGAVGGFARPRPGGSCASSCASSRSRPTDVAGPAVVLDKAVD